MQNITYADKNVTVVGLKIKFRSEPEGRGTMGIILSCVATFLFCIWGTVHPNIVVGAKSYYRLFYKAVLMLIAVVVPEGLILSAFAQYREAKELHNLWLEKYKDENEPWYTFLKFWEDSKSTFGMEGAFFVVMGGFVVASSAVDGQGKDTEQQATSAHMAQNKEYVILTSEGFKHYYRNLIDKDEMRCHRKAILDKGKASNMAKCLAGLQASWLIVQCFARWQAGLPVTLLEVHVAIQVFCTMIIFFCWWSKPLDVNEHIEITLGRKGGPCKPDDGCDQFDATRNHSSSPSKAQPCLSRRRTSLAVPDDLERGGTGAGQAGGDLKSEWDSLKSEEKKLRENREKNIAVNPTGQRFIRKRTPPDLTGITAKAFYDISSCLDNSNKTDNSDKSGNKPDRKTDWIAMGAEVSLVILAGALHAAAWYFPFQTQAGRVLWRASSVGMCASPTLAVLIASVTAYQVDLATAVWEIHLGDREDYTSKRHLRGVTKAVGDQLGRMAKRHGYQIDQQGENGRNKRHGAYMTTLHWLLICVVLLLLVAYAVSIIIITIIAFLSMRHPPVGSYNTPRWNDYWPHF
ncbi:uncharacterized protein H6S33_004906 [Morchella sextelata]|uniref:uncharacterized protein n=1 Tax=Morchella sextelata TaxID=1174677 RepID=UPI001D04C6C4|nr:uncharacterized protein H6S33_004906 [Morchella sextelata]KAH0605684.1 hypothetical protein H6S33_004906 [Morchella sextelata]